MSATRPRRTGPLAQYRALERHCARILQAARAGDWERVDRLRRRSLQMVGKLREQPPAPLEPAERSEKFRLLRSIAQIDAQVRHLTQPWTRTIDEMLAVRGAGQRPPDHPG